MKVKEFQEGRVKKAIAYLKNGENNENLEKLKERYSNNICYIYSGTDDLVNTIKLVVNKD